MTIGAGAGKTYSDASQATLAIATPMRTPPTNSVLSAPFAQNHSKGSTTAGITPSSSSSRA